VYYEDDYIAALNDATKVIIRDSDAGYNNYQFGLYEQWEDELEFVEDFKVEINVSIDGDAVVFNVIGTEVLKNDVIKTINRLTSWNNVEVK